MKSILLGPWNWVLSVFWKEDEPKWATSSLRRQAIVEPVVRHVLDRPDGIRQRALNAATIAGGAAAVLGALAAVIGVGRRPFTVQILFGAALVTWLASVFVYIRAIAFSYESTKPPGTTAAMLKVFGTYANDMRARVRFGSFLASLAVVFTIAAVVALTSDTIAASDDTARAVWLTPEAAAALPACVSKQAAQSGSVKVAAEVKVGDLGKTVVPLKLTCMEDRTYRVSRRAIVATEQRN